MALMKATATEQHVPQSVTATESDLLNTLDFDEANSTETMAIDSPKNGKVFLIETSEGEIAGMAIYFITYVAWKAKSGVCLEDLYVRPEFRCRGYARLLVQAVARKGQELGCSRMEWFCFTDNQRALKFYHDLGAKDMDTMMLLRLDGDEMVKFAHSS